MSEVPRGAVLNRPTPSFGCHDDIKQTHYTGNQ
jgi:hypothetical protein